MGLGFLDDIFCDDNMILIIIGILVVVLLLSNDRCDKDRCDEDRCDDRHGFLGKFNLGENWLLIAIVLLVVFSDGLDIF